MNYVMEALRVLAILAALIAFRFIIQAVMNNPKRRKLMGAVVPFLIPPLITGGPMFIAIAASMYPVHSPDVSPFFAYAAFGGGAATAIGLAGLAVMQGQQGREIQRLESLILCENDEGA